MDAASAALLDALTQELDSAAWVVLVTRRDVDGGFHPQAPHRRIELGPLSHSDAQTLAQATPEATELPPHVVRLAVDRAAGSPEFLLDLLAAAASRGHDALPDSVEAAATARIDALDPPDRALVRRAAILGLTFHPRRISRCARSEHPRSRRRGLGSPVDGVRARPRGAGEIQTPRIARGRVRESSLQAATRPARDRGAKPRGGPPPRPGCRSSDSVASFRARRGLFARVSVRDVGRASGRPSGSRMPTPRACTGARSRRRARAAWCRLQPRARRGVGRIGGTTRGSSWGRPALHRRTRGRDAGSATGPEAAAR